MRLDLQPLRAAAAGGAAEEGRARSAADQRRRCASGTGERDRAGAARGMVSRRGRRHRPARVAAPAGATGRSSDSVGAGRFLDWASVEPFTGHVPTVRLRVPHPKLARLHPAELADLVEAASHREGEEIIQAVGADPELEADVFEELESHHQLEFLEEPQRRGGRAGAAADGGRRRGRPGRRAAGGAARGRSSSCCRMSQRRRVRALLGLRPGHCRRADEPGVRLRLLARRPCRRSSSGSEARLPRRSPIASIYVMNTRKRLDGRDHRSRICCEPKKGRGWESSQASRSAVRPDADLEEVARLMTDYDLTVVPVVDEEDRAARRDHGRRRARARAARRAGGAGSA